MGSKNMIYEMEGAKTAAEAAAMLRELADKIESGTVSYGQGAMLVAGELTVSLEIEEKAKKDKVKRSIELELEWVEHPTPALAVAEDAGNTAEPSVE
jgi:amphi-Trp domain-containing protein